MVDIGECGTVCSVRIGNCISIIYIVQSNIVLEFKLISYIIIPNGIGIYQCITQRFIHFCQGVDPVG